MALDTVTAMRMALKVLADENAYSTERNFIRPPAMEVQVAALQAEIRSPELEYLAQFYRRANGFLLTDVCNGFFVDDIDTLLKLRHRDEPVRISGLCDRGIVVFGSDGGGGRFAADVNAGELLFLPPDGAVIEHVYLDENANDPVRLLAGSMDEFLESIVREMYAAGNA